MEGINNLKQFVGTFAEVFNIVLHELHRRIDFVGYPCRQLANRFELLSSQQLFFQEMLLGLIDGILNDDRYLSLFVE